MDAVEGFMDALEGPVGAFFRSLEPKDWTTAILSAVALLLSIVSITQKRRYHPRPSLVHEFLPSVEAPGRVQRPYLAFNLANVGTAPAIQLRFEIRSPQVGWLPLSDVIGADTLTTNESRRFEISLVAGTLQKEFDEDVGMRVSPKGETVPGVYRVRISWRQGPNTERVRKRTFRYRVRAAEDRAAVEVTQTRLRVLGGRE